MASQRSCATRGRAKPGVQRNLFGCEGFRFCLISASLGDIGQQEKNDDSEPNTHLPSDPFPDFGNP